MLENTQEILDANYFLKKRKKAHSKTKFIATKHRLFLLSCLMAFIILVTIYLISPYGKVFTVSVEGNIYYSDEDVTNMCDIDDRDIYLFVSPTKIINKLKNDALISDINVTKEAGNLIKINLKEKKIIGYIYEDGHPWLLLEDNTRSALDETNMHLIEDVPLIEGFDKDSLSIMLKNFEELDYKDISLISEIHRYQESYDDKMLKIIMADGNYIFASKGAISKIKDYYTIIISLGLESRENCIYLDDISEFGYVQDRCPWEKEIIEIPEEPIDE